MSIHSLFILIYLFIHISVCLIVSFINDSFSHSVGILLSFVLALFQGDIRAHLPPASLHA